MNIIEAKKLNYSYQVFDDDGVVEKRNQVLFDIDLDIPKGQFLAVLGHNGSGKSTLAKQFNGILTPESGSLTVCGIEVSDDIDDDNIYKIRQNVGMVFQNPDNQIVATIVEEDVAFALENLGVPSEQIRTRIDDAMKTVGIYELRGHAPHQLSGGQKQRVAIAGVIAMEPSCIVLDEPTAMLDPKGRKEVMKTIKKLNREKGITIILITHYMEEAAQAERVVVMDNGRIIMDNVPKKIFSRIGELKAVGLDVPQVSELAYLLRQSGIDIDKEIIYEDECVEAIAKLLKMESTK